MKIALAAIVAAGTALPVRAVSADPMIQFFSGQSLLALCERTVDECTNYIIGVYDTVATLHNRNASINNPRSVCLPPAAKDARLTLVVKKYLDGHPKQLQAAAPILVIAALENAFPCRTSN